MIEEMNVHLIWASQVELWATEHSASSNAQ